MGKAEILMERAQFDAMFGEIWAAKGRQAPPDEAAVPSLVDVVKRGGTKEDRVAAIEALACMGPEAKGADFLLSLLTDPDPQLPWRVLEALGPRRDWVPRVLNTLISALNDPAKKIRSRAVAMLMRLGPETSRSALSALRERLQDVDPHVQAHARDAVRLIEANQSNGRQDIHGVRKPQVPDEDRSKSARIASPTPGLTGRWAGHYTQHGQSQPIVAVLDQAENRLTGSMHDVRTEGEYSISDAVAEDGLPPAAAEEIEAKLRELVPDVPAGPIRCIWHLPSESVVEGRCEGRKVYFLKTYRGRTAGGYRVGDRLLGVEGEGHSVQYEGELSPDGQWIEGRWWIESDATRGTMRTEGKFSLRRWGDGGGRTEGPRTTPPRVRRVRWKFWSG
jgi:hypothetical protein